MTMTSSNSIATGSMPQSPRIRIFTHSKLGSSLWNLSKTLLVPEVYITPQKQEVRVSLLRNIIADASGTTELTHIRYPFNILISGVPSRPFAHLDIKSWNKMGFHREKATFQTYDELPLKDETLPAFSIELFAEQALGRNDRQINRRDYIYPNDVSGPTSNYRISNQMFPTALFLAE